MTYSIGNINLETFEEVYKPREDSEFLTTEMLKIVDTDVIEIGCGSGIVSISLAKKNPQSNYLATDLNYIAVKLTNKNIQLNCIENLQCVVTDKVDCFRINGLPNILCFNPPYLPKLPEIDKLMKFNDYIQFVGGTKGYEVISDAINKLESYQTLYILISSLATTTNDLSLLHSKFDIKEINSIKLPDREKLSLLHVRYKN